MIASAAELPEPNVLHIANWYPNRWNPSEALFVQEHFRAVRRFGKHRLVHLEVRDAACWPRLYRGAYSEDEHYLILRGRFPHPRLVEILTLLLLICLRLQLLMTRNRSWSCNWRCVNVHIAWPLMRYPRLFEALFGRKLVISEHWSAYHRGFNLPAASQGRRRLANMFGRRHPIVVVSEALGRDIQTFAQIANLDTWVVPNIVDTELFFPPDSRDDGASPVFLMVASWAPIKRPFLAIQAFKIALSDYPDARLRVVGYGHQWQAIEDYVGQSNLHDRVCLVGQRNKSEIAEEMRRAAALLHASEYETFSVVCAEALCCGTPVIASNVGGIREFVHKNNGVLVENTDTAWRDALKQFLKCRSGWNHDKIAREATGRFSPGKIGCQLAQLHRLAQQ